MQASYQIKTSAELIDYLAKHGRDAFHSFDYQLQTNYGFVHELKNGEVIFFPNNLSDPAILFNNRQCFNNVIKEDRFPVENPEKDMFEAEGYIVKSFHMQTDHYQNHLNTILKFNFEEITKQAAQAYLKKVIGRKIKKLTTARDVVALISVIGELVKAETNGKWFLEKRYGTYNPVYEPNILTASGNVYFITNAIIGLVKWRVSNLENIFKDVHSAIASHVKWDLYSKGRSNLIMLE